MTGRGAGRGVGRRAIGCGGFALLAALGGCGFSPVYARREAGAAAPAREGLAAISVAIIPERSGQLLRQALQERFERFGAAVERRYVLQASLRINDDAIAIQQDSAVTRIRVVGYVDYTLRSLDAARTTLTSGAARVLDGYNAINQQFFEGDLQNELVVRRIAEAAADQVALQLANFFDAHPSIA